MAHLWIPQAADSLPLIWRRRHGIRAILLGSVATVALALMLSA
jgi:hypothetical protein